MPPVSQTSTTLLPPPVQSPAARRLDRRRWKDPRLWVGLVLVAGSVLVGARLMAAADDTVGVWTLARDVPAGSPLSADALSVQQVRFADTSMAASYQPATEPPEESAVATRDLSAGELLPRASVGDADGPMLHLPVVVSAAGAPGNLRAGDVVDVWVVPPQSPSGSSGPATQALDDVPVIGAGGQSGPLGEAATRQVLLGLDDATKVDLGTLLSRVSNGTVVLIRAGS
jgi:hypothetical protein